MLDVFHDFTQQLVSVLPFECVDDALVHWLVNSSTVGGQRDQLDLPHWISNFGTMWTTVVHDKQDLVFRF